MVDADTHPSGIRGQVIDPVGHRATEFLDQEVMDPDIFGVALGAIFAPVVAEIADQFLFLGVDRDHRLLFTAVRFSWGSIAAPFGRDWRRSAFPGRAGG